MQQVVGKTMTVISARVVAVQDKTCTVEITSGLKLTDVRLMPTLNTSTNEFVITPKVDSEVLLLSVAGDLSNLVVVSVDEVESIRYVFQDTEFIIDGLTGKVKLSNATTDLKSIFSDLITAIKQITVSTLDGPSGTPLPPTITALNVVQNKINSLLQ